MTCRISGRLKQTMFQKTIFSKSILIALGLLAATQLTAMAKDSAQSEAADTKSFDKLYADWTKAFNKKDMAGTMSIFSTTCVASLPDANHKTYDQIRDGFKKLFADKTHNYQYTYTVHNIYHSGDLAAVRITWHLTATSPGKPPEKNNELGLDVLKQDSGGAWKIVNWVAFSDRYNPAVK